MGDELISLSTRTRPTHHRLWTAMGISAGLVAALLEVLVALGGPVSGISLSGIELRERLILVIRKADSQPVSDPATEYPDVPSLPQEETVIAEHADAPQNPVLTNAPVLSAEVEPLTDWQAIAQEAAKASVDEDSRHEASRARMWLQSRSMMFQPAPNLNAGKANPALPDFRFKPQIHVVGLGVTIGSCFFGVPLVGVPVEQRTVAITLFVCASDSG